MADKAPLPFGYTFMAGEYIPTEPDVQAANDDRKTGAVAGVSEAR